MRIAIWFNLPAGGAKRALHTHVQGLLRRGHHVEAWCPPAADRAYLPLSSLIPEHVVALDHGDPPWWRAGRRAALASPRPLLDALVEHSKRCAADMLSGGFDCYLAMTCQYSGSPPIARFLPAPRALYLQEPQRWLYEASPMFPWLAPPFPTSAGERLAYPARVVVDAVRSWRRGQRARFEVDNASQFDTVIVNSLYSRETVLRTYGIEAEVCGLGVDTERFRPTDAPREDMVVGVGSLSTQKNALLLVEAVGRLARPRPRVAWFATGGDPRYRATVEQAAARLDVTLTIHDAASDEDLVAALGRAVAVVYTPRLEPFGLVPLEAAACGTPVVGVAEGGVRETVVDGINGLMVRPHAEGIARAIDELRSKPAWAEELGRNGRRMVEERWTVDGAARRLERLLASSVG
jgi:glycosyltransferase involved in cell wall biosynthesis